MARVHGLLKFPDGEIRVFMYCDTADVVFDYIFGSFKNFEDARDLYNNNKDKFGFTPMVSVKCNHKPERIELFLPVYNKYWIGSACKACNKILSGIDPACNFPIREYSNDYYQDTEYYDCGDEGFPSIISPPDWVIQYMNEWENR